MQKYLGYIIAVALLIAFFLFRGCGPDNVRVETEYIYDTTERVIIKEIPKVVETIHYREVPKLIRDTITLTKHDTLAIVTQWMDSLKTFEDVRRDTNIEATITDTIYQNEIVGRSFAYKILRPTIVNTYKPDRFQLILSAQMGTGISYNNEFNSIFGGVDLGLKFKSGTYFSLGYMAGESHFATLRVGQVIRLKR
jgi:hypothetical protein